MLESLFEEDVRSLICEQFQKRQEVLKHLFHCLSKLMTLNET